MRSENSSNGTVQNRDSPSTRLWLPAIGSLEPQHYAATTINLRLAAVREAADCGLLSADLAAGIRRVKGAKRLGVPVGNWLSADEIGQGASGFTDILTRSAQTVFTALSSSLFATPPSMPQLL
jgi:hypothetical protein